LHAYDQRAADIIVFSRFKPELHRERVRANFIESLRVSKLRERQRRAPSKPYLLTAYCTANPGRILLESAVRLSRGDGIKLPLTWQNCPHFADFLEEFPRQPELPTMHNRFIDSERRGTTLSLLYDTNTVGNDLWERLLEPRWGGATPNDAEEYEVA